MKIVIDIPENTFIDVKNGLLLCYDTIDIAKKITGVFQNSVQLSEVFEDIKSEIKELKCPFGSYGEWYDGVNDCIKVINKHIVGGEQE